MTHKHKWECSDIPAIYFCDCGIEAYWDRNKQEFYTLPTEEKV